MELNSVNPKQNVFYIHGLDITYNFKTIYTLHFVLDISTEHSLSQLRTFIVMAIVIETHNSIGLHYNKDDVMMYGANNERYST